MPFQHPRPAKHILLTRVLEAERSGKTMTQLAAEHGVSRVTFYRWMASHNISPKMRRRSIMATPELLRHQRAKGMSWDDIAALLGVSSRALRMWREKLREEHPDL